MIRVKGPKCQFKSVLSQTLGHVSSMTCQTMKTTEEMFHCRGQSQSTALWNTTTKFKEGHHNKKD